eukprot:TRINITY_DN14473_c0_g1_i2.p1 TRINITY_DN14473_c0_g1~~TRINITY_DN14473_c0_g1_i2.p1  ORF type:complete len:344 (+),score=62.65 TRINITY_DN14473_c0_g1_i2:129-1160(+)
MSFNLSSLSAALPVSTYHPVAYVLPAGGRRRTCAMRHRVHTRRLGLPYPSQQRSSNTTGQGNSSPSYDTLLQPLIMPPPLIMGAQVLSSPSDKAVVTASTTGPASTPTLAPVYFAYAPSPNSLSSTPTACPIYPSRVARVPKVAQAPRLLGVQLYPSPLLPPTEIRPRPWSCNAPYKPSAQDPCSVPAKDVSMLHEAELLLVLAQSIRQNCTRQNTSREHHAAITVSTSTFTHSFRGALLYSGGTLIQPTSTNKPGSFVTVMHLTSLEQVQRLFHHTIIDSVEQWLERPYPNKVIINYWSRLFVSPSFPFKVQYSSNTKKLAVYFRTMLYSAYDGHAIFNGLY